MTRLTVALCCGLLLLVIGCGGDDESGEDTESQAELETLAEAIDGDDAAARLAAVKRAGELGPEGAGLLVKAFSGDDAAAREAAEAQIKKQGAELVPALLAALADQKDADVEGVRGLIRSAGPEAEPHLHQGLSSDKRAIRLHALEVLAAMQALDGVARALNDEHAQVRTRAQEVLVASHPPRAVSALVRAGRDAEGALREAVVATLARVCGTKKGFDAVIKVCRKGEDQDLSLLGDGLAGAGEQVIPRLVGALKQRSGSVVTCVSRALARYGTAPVQALMQEALERRSWFAAKNYLVALSGLEVSALMIIIKETATKYRTYRDEPAKVEVMKALQREYRRSQSLLGEVCKRKGEDAVDTLVEALQDSDPVIRMVAAAGLESMGARAKGALPALRQASSDADPDVKAAAEQAVRRISGS